MRVGMARKQDRTKGIDQLTKGGNAGYFRRPRREFVGNCSESFSNGT